MPLSRRSSSFLRQTSSELPVPGSVGRRGSAGATAARGVFPGSAPSAGAGTRVCRRALGVSSVFLQGTRSSAAPVVERGGAALRGPGLDLSLKDYSTKVKALENLNQDVQREIRQSLERRTDSATSWKNLRTEWADLYAQVIEGIVNNARLMLQTESVHANADDFRERLESEQSYRKSLQDEISSFYKVIDDAQLTRAELEEQMENMRAELWQLEQMHEQNIGDLCAQMSGHEEDQPEEPEQTSLQQIFLEIRHQWDKLMEQNPPCQEQQSFSTRLSPEQNQVDELQSECHSLSRKIQSLEGELETIRTLKRGLENSLGDARHWHEVELQNLGSVVTRLEAELNDVHVEIEQQRRHYDALLSDKHRLEQEIGTYHKILDQEEQQQEHGGPPAPQH